MQVALLFRSSFIPSHILTFGVSLIKTLIYFTMFLWQFSMMTSSVMILNDSINKCGPSQLKSTEKCPPIVKSFICEHTIEISEGINESIFSDLRRLCFLFPKDNLIYDLEDVEDI